MENQEMMEKGSFKKLFLKMCIPTIIIMLVMVIYNMTDTFFIGKTNDPYKIAAISLCAPIFSILSGLGTLLGSGGCTVIAVSLGEKNFDKIKHITSFCFYGALVLGLLFCVGLNMNLDKVSMLIGADADTLGYASSYLRIIAIGSPIIMFTNIFMNLIRADGAAAQSMIANLLGTVVNVVLDPIFILIFHMDVAGAAIATVIGNIVSAIYILYYVVKKQKQFSLSFKDFTLKKDIVLPVLTLGLPLACSTILMSCSSMMMNNVLVSYGSIVVAANGVASKVNMVISMVAMGICMGLQPAVSYSFGAKNNKRMYHILKNMGILTVVVGSVLTVICFIFRNQFVCAFIKNEEVVSIAITMLTISLISGPLYGLYQLETTFLQSTQNAKASTFLSLLNKGIVYIPVMYALNAAFGLHGVFFTVPVTDITSLIIGAIICMVWKKKVDRV